MVLLRSNSGLHDRNCEEWNRDNSAQWHSCDCDRASLVAGEFPSRWCSNLNLYTSVLLSIARQRFSTFPSNLLWAVAEACSHQSAQRVARNQTSRLTTKSWSVNWLLGFRLHVWARLVIDPSNAMEVPCLGGDTDTSCWVQLSALDFRELRDPFHEPKTRTTFYFSCTWDSEYQQNSLPLPIESR